MAKIEITQELVKELFDYKDGFLYWKKVTSSASRVKIGDKAGYLQKKEGHFRRRVYVKYIQLYSSRIIFLWHHGWLPKEVDHEDRNTLNEKIENLRAATPIQNCSNRASHCDSVSRYKGVTLKKTTNRWGANISVNKKVISLGYHKTEAEAALAYNKAAVKLHKEFAYLNIIQPEQLNTLANNKSIIR